jgi:hypothetical protein
MLSSGYGTRIKVMFGSIILILKLIFRDIFLKNRFLKKWLGVFGDLFLEIANPFLSL